MKIIPLSVIAKWPTPNYVNPETHGASLLIANCVMAAVSLVVVGIRIYTRVWISRNFGWDDVFILIATAWILGVVGLAATTYTLFGGERHVWDTPISTFPALLKYTLANQIVFGQAIAFIKLSTLFLTKRIMGQGSQTVRTLIFVGMAYVVAGNISYTLVLIFQCTPVTAQFKLSLIPPKCINVGAHMVAASVVNAISDFLVVLIPIPVVLKLKMRYRQRAIVIGLFATGFVVCIVAIVRTVFTVILISPGHYDYTWDSFPVYICSALEMYLAIICASIPPTRGFFSHYWPKLFPTTTTSGSKTDKKHNTGTGVSRRFYSSYTDEGKGIPLSPMSDFSSSSRSNHTCKAEYSHEAHKIPGKNQINVTVVIDALRKDSSGSESETSREKDSHRNTRAKQWRTVNGSRGGEPMIQKVESQTSLIEEKST